MISGECKTCTAVAQPVDLLFFCAWSPHLFAELLSVPQLSHSLFRLSIALFGLHNAATHQQGFPLSNSLRNVYLHTHTNMRRWSQRLMAIRCKCSAVCILGYCNTELTESAEIWYQIHAVNIYQRNQWLNWCLGSVHCFTFRCEDGYFILEPLIYDTIFGTDVANLLLNMNKTISYSVSVWLVFLGTYLAHCTE